MAFCTKCGGELAAGASFCPKCGTAQTAGAVVAPPTQAAQAGMSEHVAGALCYLVGWITGLIFFLIDKRPFVRFHAAQSMVVFGGLHVLHIALAMVFGMGMLYHSYYGGFGLGMALYSLISLVAFVLWIVLMVKAFQHDRFEVPIAGGIAKNISGS